MGPFFTSRDTSAVDGPFITHANDDVCELTMQILRSSGESLTLIALAGPAIFFYVSNAFNLFLVARLIRAYFPRRCKFSLAREERIRRWLTRVTTPPPLPSSPLPTSPHLFVMLTTNSNR